MRSAPAAEWARASSVRTMVVARRVVFSPRIAVTACTASKGVWLPIMVRPSWVLILSVASSVAPLIFSVRKPRMARSWALSSVGSTAAKLTLPAWGSVAVTTSSIRWEPWRQASTWPVSAAAAASAPVASSVRRISASSGGSTQRW